MSKLLRDAAANDLALHKVYMNVIEYSQILQGKRTPAPVPKQEPASMRVDLPKERRELPLP